jgi:membrane protease subunit HflK
MSSAPLTPTIFLLVSLLAALTGAVLKPEPLIVALVAWSAWTTGLALYWLPTPRPRSLRILRRLALCALPVLTALALVHLFRPLPFLANGMTTDAPVIPSSALIPFLVLDSLLGFFLQTYAGLRAASATGWAPAFAAATLRATNLAAAFLAATLLAQDRFGFLIERPAAIAISAILVFWILEVLLRAAARAFQPVRQARLLPPLGGSLLLTPFLSAPLRAAWKTPTATDAPTLALADLWFIPTLRRLLFPLLATAAALLWLGSTLHEVPHGHLGIETRLGRATAGPLAPGLHFTWPAPFAAVRTLPTERLQSIVLGAAADTGKPILWERDHYVDEESRLVGGGEELLTLSVPIFYHIKDPLAYARHTADAPRLVRDLADQILQTETTRLPAFAIMTTERERISATLHTRVQAELDRRQSGLAIAFVALRDIHPPVAVGPAFQDVVSAIEDRETYRHEGERLRAEALPRVAAEVTKLRTESDTILLTRVEQATGQAARFTAQQSAYAAQPEVYRLRQTYARYDESLREAKKLVLSDTFRGRLATTLDIRRTLNPDFNPPPAAISPTLIPTPPADTRPDAFERAVDGYLNAGRGAIPAVDLKAGNPDHLIDPAAGEARR